MIKNTAMSASDDSLGKKKSPAAIGMSNLDDVCDEAIQNHNISKNLDDSFKRADKSNIEYSFDLFSRDKD